MVFANLAPALYQIHLSSISIHNTKIALRRSLPSEPSPTSNSAHLGLLMACLESTKIFWTQWFSISPSVYHHLPINVFSLVVNAAMVLGMLNLFQCDGWDLDLVREMMPFSSTMDRLAHNYEEASRETNDGKESGCSAFCRDGIKMKRLVDWYDMKLNGLRHQKDQPSALSDPLVESAMRDVVAGLDVDILDEAFWNETMAWTAWDNMGETGTKQWVGM